MEFFKKFRNKEDIRTLEQFVKSNWINSLTNDQSIKNLENGLIEIVYPNGQHKGNGILVTENGYFLTAEHCLDKKLNSQYIKTFNKIYRLERICIENRDNDLVLAKVNIKNKPLIKNYKFYNTDILEKIPVQLLIKRDGIINRKYGLIERDWNLYKCSDGNYYKDNFSLNYFTSPGDSGGIIISPLSELVGLVQGANKVISSCIKINDALNLIYKYIHS